MGSQKIVVHPWVIIKSFQLGGAGNLEQILISSFVFSKQHQMVRMFVFLRIAIPHGAGSHVRLQPDDGFHAFFHRGFKEINHTEHGAMIGNSNRGHAHFFYALNQLLNIAKAIQQGVFSMYMQMGE